MQLNRFILSVFVTAVALCTGRSAADSIAVRPAFDLWGVDESRDGDFDQLPSNSVANLVGGGTNGLSTDFRSAIEFPLASIPASMRVDSAFLVLTRVLTTSGGTSFMDMYIHSYPANGGFNLADLLTDNPVAGPFRLNSDSVPDRFEIDVSAAVRSLHTSRATHAGFTLRAENVPADAFVVQFGSMENPVDSNRPTLLVAYSVPEPSTCILFMVGVASFCGGQHVSRRRHRDRRLASGDNPGTTSPTAQ
jgi:hypothetical protein